MWFKSFRFAVEHFASVLVGDQLDRATIERLRDARWKRSASCWLYPDEEEVERIMGRIEAFIAALLSKE